MSYDVNSRTALTLLGVLVLVSALMQSAASFSGLFGLVLYWTGCICIPGFLICVLSAVNTTLPEWERLFLPASFYGLLMPLMCLRERCLSDSMYMLFSCLMLVFASFWLSARIIVMARSNGEHAKPGWMRHLFLYGIVVPAAAVLVVEFMIVRGESNAGLLSSALWRGWATLVLEGAFFKGFQIAGMLLAALCCFCVKPVLKTGE